MSEQIENKLKELEDREDEIKQKLKEIVNEMKKMDLYKTYIQIRRNLYESDLYSKFINTRDTLYSTEEYKKRNKLIKERNLIKREKEYILEKLENEQ